jgi:hypothetical protein
LRQFVPDSVFYCPLLQTPSPQFINIFQLPGDPITPHYGYNALGAVWQGSPPYNPGLGGDLNFQTGLREPTSANRVATLAQMITIGDSATFIDPILGTQPQTNIPNQIYIVFPFIVEPLGYLGVGNGHDGAANMFSAAHNPFGLRRPIKAGECGTATISPTRSGGKPRPAAFLQLPTS